MDNPSFFIYRKSCAECGTKLKKQTRGRPRKYCKKCSYQKNKDYHKDKMFNNLYSIKVELMGLLAQINTMLG